LSILSGRNRRHNPEHLTSCRRLAAATQSPATLHSVVVDVAWIPVRRAPRKPSELSPLSDCGDASYKYPLVTWRRRLESNRGRICNARNTNHSRRASQGWLY